MSFTDQLAAYQQHTFRLLPSLRLTSIEGAISFVNERGFILFWPNKGIHFPSLWNAVAGDRPVPDAHDDPGHITWGWKDNSLGKRRWYYGRVLNKRNAMLSLDMTPFFYALSRNYGSPEEDYLLLYEEGQLTQEARQIYEAILERGALDTLALRREARMSSEDASARFERALTELQADFRILPIGVAEVGAWRYAFIYEAVHRHFPDLIEQAHSISENEARIRLAERYFEAMGAACAPDLARLFRWSLSDGEKTIQTLVERSQLLHIDPPANIRGDWYRLASLSID